LREAAVFEVFRFALFAVRTFFGVILLILALYAALWVFVKILSAAPGNDEPRGALGRVESYNSRAAAGERAAPAREMDQDVAPRAYRRE
jgi:hypothetical protein